jgi:DNA-binding MarR family transcriptional regulator
MADPMTAKDPLLLDQQLCFSLYSASLAMTQLYKPLLESMGLTFPQYLIMLVLWEHDGLTLKELSNRLRQDSGALTPVVKRLEAAGLVTRRRSAEDERNLSIELTPAGRTLRDQANGVNSRVRQVCALGDAGLDDLRETLVMLRSRLDEEGNPTS